MKIIEVIPNLNSGGGEQFVVDLSNEFSKLGHVCQLITFYNLTHEDIFVNFLSPSVNHISLNKKKSIDIRLIFRLYKLIKSEKPDIVHLHLNTIPYIILASLILRKTKYFATIHSEAKREAGKGINKIIRQFLFKNKLVTAITISEESEKSFELFYKTTGTTILNGRSQINILKENKWKHFHDKIDFLFCHAGRIHKVKNQILLVKVFKKLIENGFNVRLLIAGKISDSTIFNNIEPYFSDNIIYLGEQTEIREIMSICDAFCLTSTMEGLPITIIESMSVGCIPISTPVGGCINIIKNRFNGFISNGLNLDDYYNTILNFISSPRSEIEKISKNAISEFNSKYSIQNCAEQYIKTFKNKINE